MLSLSKRLGRRARCHPEGRGEDQGDRCQREHRRVRACGRRIEMLFRSAHPSGQHRGPENEQDIPDDRPHDGGLYDIVQACTQRGECDNEFSGVAEGRVEKPADALAHLLGELFRSPAHGCRKRQNGKRGGQENKEMPVGSEELEADRHGNEEQKPVHRLIEPCLAAEYRRRAPNCDADS